MESCVFCDIVKGKNKQSRTVVYKDKYVSAFMDELQPHPGHVLIVPNKHLVTIFELDEELAAHIFKVTTKIAKAVREAFNPGGLNIYQCNEECAGQSVCHFHIHIFPREREDNLFQIYSEGCPEKSNKKTLDLYKKELQKFL